MQSNPKKEYLDLGKFLKARTSLSRAAAVFSVGFKSDIDLSSFLVKVASLSSWGVGVGRFSRCSVSQVAPASARV